MFKAIVSEVREWIEGVLAYVPGRTGYWLRARWYSLLLGTGEGVFSLGRGTTIIGSRNIHLHGAVSVGEDCLLSAGQGRLEFGEGTFLNRNVSIVADFSEIKIGRDVLIAMGVTMRSAGHRFDRSPAIPIREQGHDRKPIIVGNDIWIGANAVILGGVTIGDHSVVAAGSVVTRDVPPCSLVMGVPARVVRTLDGTGKV